MKLNKRTVLEIILAIVFVGILIYLLQEHAPKILKLLESGNATEIDDYLKKYGTLGKALLVLMQVVETISIVLPAVPVYICSGVLFGKIKGTIVCYSVNLLLNLAIFEFARSKSESNRKEFDMGKHKALGEMIQKAKHMERVVIAMCLLPIVPNGMIPYLSVQTNVTTKEFMKALAIGSLPSIVLYVCCGDVLTSSHYKITAPMVVVIVILAALAFVFRKKLIAKVKPAIMKFIEG